MRRNTNGHNSNLSRDERTKLYGESGFAPLQHVERCPDCRDNELSPPATEDPESRGGREIGPPRTFACETCGGQGTVPLRGKARFDPYMTPLAVSLAPTEA